MSTSAAAAVAASVTATNAAIIAAHNKMLKIQQAMACDKNVECIEHILYPPSNELIGLFFLLILFFVIALSLYVAWRTITR